MTDDRGVSGVGGRRWPGWLHWAVTVILLVVLIGIAVDKIRRGVEPRTRSPEAEKILAQYKQTMESMQQYYGSVDKARPLAFRGESEQAKAILAEAVDKARAGGVLPMKLAGIPSEGEMLLASLYGQTEPGSPRSQAFREYMAKVYPRYDARQYDWYLKRQTTRSAETNPS